MLVIGKSVIKQMAGDTHNNSSLALELTEMGLSLFVCDEDVPVECIAHVSLDDPDFSKKLSMFRPAAEKTVGKGFETHIWLPDEQVMFRSLKLDEEDTSDAREAASSALSASTPFHGDSLCFDLGDANGAGYTPVAAIPREKMDEAMAFARKMRMNPRLITTSNVVSGFSTRPNFKPHVAELPKRAAPVRVAALAMMLAAPIFLLSAELDGNLNGRPDAGNAFVASFETIDVDPTAPSVAPVAAPETAAIDVPSSSVETTITRDAPQLALTDLPVAPDTNAAAEMVSAQQSVFTMGGTLVLSASEASKVLLPATGYEVAQTVAPVSFSPVSGPVETASIAAQLEVLRPAIPQFDIDEISISSDDGLRAISLDLPLEMFRPGPDRLPETDMLAVEYVESVFAGDIEIHDLVAVDEVSGNAFSNPDADPSLVRVANFGEGVLIRRPEGRVAPKLVQPAFMPRPEKRPLPLLPEQAFDYNTMIPIDPVITVEDPPPLVNGSIDTAPSVTAPQGLVFVSDEATEVLIEKAAVRRRELAVLAAEARRNGPLANLISPKVRSAVPLAGSNGALVQTQVIAAMDFAASEANDLNPLKVDTAPVSGALPIQMAAVQNAALDLPEGLAPQTRPMAVVRELVPYKPGEPLQEPSVRLVSVAPVPTIPRPPSRRAESTELAASIEQAIEEVASTPDVIASDREAIALTGEQVVDAVETVETAEAVETVEAENSVQTAATPEVTEPTLQAEIAAAAVPSLILPRPPARPERASDVAALIRQLDAVPTVDGPVSKYAIDQLYAPAKRPAGLQAQAKKIIEQRNSVTNQVAIKQQPVAATPQKSLRIPTGARVGTAATIKDGIALGDISLIGIYGTTKTRRALVRLPQGRYVQISRGDAVSGWTVSAVSEDAVRIQKGSKNKVLRLPN